MLSDDLVFESQDQLKVLAVERHADSAVIFVIRQLPHATCPICCALSNSKHSIYSRTIKDLPAFGNKIYINLKVRKFYCRNPDCEKSIFAERFDGYFTPYKRTSDRLQRKLLKIALLAGGNAGERLYKTLSIPISSSTLIRLIHEQEPDVPTSEAIGIDDWAFKKGVNYGTAIVDLNQRKIIDLLPDRKSETVENWLKDKPYIKIVTRDRYARYAKGVTNGAPNATQVADRWHLLKNMGDALQKLLERKRQDLRRDHKSSDLVVVHNNAPVIVIKDDTECRSSRQFQMDQIKQLYSSGVSIRRIADTLKMSRITIRKYLYLDTPPSKNSARNNIALFAEYIQKRIEEDKEIQVINLWKEIKEKGYSGCRSVLYEYLKGYVKPQQRLRMPMEKSFSWIPRKVSLLLYRKENTLSRSDKELLNMLYEKSPDIKKASMLAKKFRRIMENRQGHLLKNWVAEVETSSLKELSSFARGLLNDYHAVKNALTLPWSNGQVEGQVNKLKTIKRQMYGRASFSLMRKRMILFGNLST